MSLRICTANTSQNKNICFEIMRIVAIFFVIFNHTGNNGYFMFAQWPTNSIQFWIYMLLSVFCRFSVPLFLAISGALMLKRTNVSLKRLTPKILKMICTLIVFSICYYIFDTIQRGGNFDWVYAAKRLYSNNLKFHLWYLYLYIAYLISLPFLCAMVRNLETKYFYCMIFFAILFNGILPIGEYVITQGTVTLNNSLEVSWLVSDIILYPCIGYFIQERLDYKKIKEKLPLLWIINLCGLLICCFMTFYKSCITNTLLESESQTFHKSFVVLNCITIFCTFKVLFENIHLKNKGQKAILSIGKATFGIYLLHPFMIIPGN